MQLQDKQIGTTILELVGNTPLLRLGRIAGDLPGDVEVYAKAEWYNPGGSVKDRAALWMIRAGERSGALQSGMRIADATSGNTGIAYATLGAALGYGVTVAMPSNASSERKRVLRSLGAEVILTDAAEGMDLAIKTIRERVAEQPERYFYPDQYNNRGQCRGALRNYRPRDLAPDRRARDTLRRRAGHQRHLYGRRAALARAAAGDQADQHAA